MRAIASGRQFIGGVIVSLLVAACGSTPSTVGTLPPAAASGSSTPTLGPVAGTIALPSDGGFWNMRGTPDSVWLWNGDDGTVARIDPATEKLAWSINLGGAATTLFGSPASVEPDGTAAWALDVAGQAAIQLDPATGATTRKLRIPPLPGGGPYDPQDLAIDGGSLWVSDFGAGDVRRFDMASGRLLATIPVPHATALLAAFGSIWVTEHREAAVARIDPATNRVTATVKMPGKGIQDICGMCLGRLVATETAIWVPLTYGEAVVSIDPATTEVGQDVRLPVGNPALEVVPDVAFAGGSAWAIDSSNDGECTFTTDYLARIDPAAGVVEGTETVGCAAAIAAVGNEIWVVQPDRGMIARIRTSP